MAGEGRREPRVRVEAPLPAPASYRVAVIPGDGIGPEVVAAACRVVNTAGERFGFRIRWQPLTVGGAAIDAFGTPLREEDLVVCRAADAVLLGAIGGPQWDDPSAAVRPEQALFRLRQALELFANLRPVRVEPSVAASSPLRPELLDGVDLLIVRELTGGLYFGAPSGERLTRSGRQAVDTMEYSETEIRRSAWLAFELARSRRRHVTSVDKANVLATSRLWRRVVAELAEEFPDVAVEHRLVDACAMMLVKRPAGFDVIVTENTFGDILSDEASILAGSLGMLPSASIGARRTGHGLYGMYEPVHGTAPHLARRDRANPVGSILSGAMLLGWSLGLPEAAEAIESAVRAVLEAGYRTPDLLPASPEERERSRPVGLSGFTEAVVEQLARGPDGVARA